MMQKLYEMLQQIKSITGIEDIAYHKIENGELHPILKLDTEHLTDEHWKEQHGKLRVQVDSTWVLKAIAYEKKTVYMNDTEKAEDVPKEFELFGIKTILLIAVVKNDVTVGMFDIASIGKVVELSETQIRECEKLAQAFSLVL